MARQYTLHSTPQTLEARCIFCPAVWTYGEGEVKGAQIDLPEHMRKNDDTKICPGSNYTVKLRYQARSVNQPEPEDVPKDSDLFPFGVHQRDGHTYGQVPADYYDWVQDQPWIKKWPKVLAYIQANKAAIEKDL